MNSYAIYVTLKPYMTNVTSEQAAELSERFRRHPDYAWNDQQQSALRAELYKALLPLVGSEHIIAATTALMKLQRV